MGASDLVRIDTLELADASNIDFDRIGPDPIEEIVPFPIIRFKTTGLLYHETITDEQREFTENPVKFRAEQAAVGSGKSAMGTIEGLQQSWYYRRNFGFIIRKTMPQMEISAIPDLMDVTPSWMILSWSKQNKILELINQYGYKYMQEIGQHQRRKDWYPALQDIGGTSTIVFTSFEGTKDALSKWESASIGWYMIDQAEHANDEIYGMLNHRMRRVPSQRRAWFLANFRKDIPVQMEWLWRLFSEDSTEYRENHWYSSNMTTESNSKNTPADWHVSLQKTMTEEEKARYLEGDVDKMTMTKAVFSEFSRDMHVIKHEDPPLHWTKGVGLDPGIGNPTAFIEAAFSPAGDFYVYNEFEKNKMIVSEIASLLLTLKTPQHLWWFIDATAGNTNQITGTDVAFEFCSFGLPFALAPRNVGAGILRMREFLKFDKKHVNPFTGKVGSPRMLISDRCPILAEQLMLYRLDENKTIGLKNETEKFRQWRDHEVDATRFLIMGATPPVGVKVAQSKPRVVSFPGGVPGTVIQQPDFISAEGRLDFSKIAARAMVPIKKHAPPTRTRKTPWSEVQRNAL